MRDVVSLSKKLIGPMLTNQLTFLALFNFIPIEHFFKALPDHLHPEALQICVGGCRRFMSQ